MVVRQWYVVAMDQTAEHVSVYPLSLALALVAACNPRAA
jgi:hypothetical protein